MESTNTSRGVRHVCGKTSASGCTVIPKPGPEVRASPSFWYFLGEILRRRSANTAATRYKVLRVLYRWLAEEEELPNPIARMKPPIVPEQPIPIVPADGLRRLLAACAGKGFEARRDTAIIMLLLDTGARRAELADLQLVGY